MAIEMRCLIPDLHPTAAASPPHHRAARDLLARLLEPNPQLRLRSLYALERIAMYQNFSFADVRNKMVYLVIFYLVISEFLIMVFILDITIAVDCRS